MLNLQWLKSLLAVLEQGSFQAAASALGLAQPTVTQHVQKLEEDLGVTLIQRSRTGCRPTREALALLPHAQSLLRLSGRAIAALRNGQSRVGASSNIGIYLLQPYVHDFLKGHDPECLELLIDRNPAIASKLMDGEIDIGVMEWWDDRPGFFVRRWRTERLVLIVSPDHPWARKPFATSVQLAGVELLGGEPGTGTGRLIDAYLDKSASRPRVSRQLGSTEAVKQAVRAGLGVSLVLESAVQHELRAGILRAIPFLEPPLEKDLFVIWRAASLPQQDPPAFAAHLLAGAPPGVAGENPR